jgi:hypothetical protein
MTMICQFPNCQNAAKFGYEEDDTVLFCNQHKTEDMIVIKGPRDCDVIGCNKNAYFKSLNKDANIRKSCRDHKEEGMVPLIYSKCCLCDRKGIYFDPQFARDTHKKYCRIHKQEGMICYKTRLCEEDDCLKRARYNYPWEDKPLYCGEHKKQDMINVNSAYEGDPDNEEEETKNTKEFIKSKCLECNEKALYNYHPPAIYCKNHKRPDMIVVLKGKCQICGKRARFNFHGPPPIYCTAHKTEGMIDVYAPKCRECNSRAYYGPRETKEKLFCSRHRKYGMVNNTYGTLCLKCDRRAIYGIEEGNPQYCMIHREEGMIRVAKTIKKCNYPGCNNYAKYHHKDKNLPRYCSVHKNKNMTTKSICRFDGCERYATYSFENERLMVFCEEHKKKGMIKRRHTDDENTEEDRDKIFELNTVRPSKIRRIEC